MKYGHSETLTALQVLPTSSKTARGKFQILFQAREKNSEAIRLKDNLGMSEYDVSSQPLKQSAQIRAEQNSGMKIRELERKMVSNGLYEEKV